MVNGFMTYCTIYFCENELEMQFRNKMPIVFAQQ